MPEEPRQHVVICPKLHLRLKKRALAEQTTLAEIADRAIAFFLANCRMEQQSKFNSFRRLIGLRKAADQSKSVNQSNE